MDRDTPAVIHFRRGFTMHILYVRADGITVTFGRSYFHLRHIRTAASSVGIHQ